MTTNQLENIKVAVRLRPFTEKEKQKNNKRIVDIEQNTVVLYSPRNKNDIHLKRFTFDYSYWSHDGFKRDQNGLNVPDSTQLNHEKYVGQEKVFEDLGQFLLFNALQGYNSALLAYGQTGSGKSYTVSGYGKNEGILPRFARALFEELEKKTTRNRSNQLTDDMATSSSSTLKVDQEQESGGGRGKGEGEVEGEEEGTRNNNNNNNNRYEVYFSMIEIYNEVVRDLLSKNHGDILNQSTITRKGLKVREHPKHGFFVEHLTSYLCADKEEIEQRIGEGHLNKSIAATSMNETSSRGHTIYEFRIKQYKTNTTTSVAHDTSSGSTSSTLIDGGSDLTPITETLLTTSVVQLVDLAGSERAAIHAVQQHHQQQQQQQQLAFSSGGNENFFRSSMRQSPVPRGGDLAANNNNNTTNNKIIPNSASSSSSANTIGTFSVRKMNAIQNNLLLNANTQQRFKESVSINQSLSALGNCIQVMSQYSQQLELANQQQTIRRPKIPYRDSALTKLLNRCCLSGNSKVVIIATLSPADINYDDTLSTLRFADRAKQIRTHAIVNRMSRNDIAVVDSLQKENKRLKQIVDGRVTRSDDSSQTSNFDENENIMENLTGYSKIPTKTSSGGSSVRNNNNNNNNKQSGTNKRSGHKTVKSKQLNNSSGLPNNNYIDSVATPLRSRTTIKKSNTQNKITTDDDENYLLKTGSNKQNISSASSNPSISTAATNRFATTTNKNNDKFRRTKQQMNKLVSPADNKSTLMKSKSMGNGMSNIGQEQATNDEDYNGNGEEDYDVNYELDRLHKNDIEEDSDIVDDIKEGLISPDSDDSFAALADEDLTNEEKINIFNRLLSNSTINKQSNNNNNYNHEEATNNNNNNDTDDNNNKTKKTLTRPKRSSRIRAGIREVAILSSSLKKTNPYLSNLNQDEQLSGMISYIIKNGETIVGKSNDSDIVLHGPELRGRHAKLTRESSPTNGITAVYLEPILFDNNNNNNIKNDNDEDPKKESTNVALMVNGIPVKEKIKLNHCDRILFGTNAYFVFSDYIHDGKDNDNNSTIADLDLVTFDMARNEVLRKVMAEAKNEAMIKEIRDYTHRPGTGKLMHRTSNSIKDKAKENSNNDNNLNVTEQQEKSKEKSGETRSYQANKKLNRSIKTIQDDSDFPHPIGKQTTFNNNTNEKEPLVTKQENEKDFSEKEKSSGSVPKYTREELAEQNQEESETTLNYRDQLMEDTYEYAMPVAEVNAVAKEMGIKVTYGLKILTGEEQLPQDQINYIGSSYIDSNTSDVSSSAGGESEILDTNNNNNNKQQGSATSASSGANKNRTILDNERITQLIKLDDLDIPPALYVKVHLDELDMDFYWSKEKFQARRYKISELYGAWDVGGKSGLVEHLIEKSKASIMNSMNGVMNDSSYLFDPFIDDPSTTFVLIGNAQITLQPISHQSDIKETYDLLDVDDNTVGSISVEVVPCHDELLSPTQASTHMNSTGTTREQEQSNTDNLNPDNQAPLYRPFNEDDLRKNFLENPRDLLGKKLIFMLIIKSCQNISHKYLNIFCQYSLKPETNLIRTKLLRSVNSDLNLNSSSNNNNNNDNSIFNENENEISKTPPKQRMSNDEDVNRKTNNSNSIDEDKLEFNHLHYIFINKVNEDLLNFLEHGFLTIQVVGQYRYQNYQFSSTSMSSSSASASASSSAKSPTVVSTIINSINRYKFKMEKQHRHHNVHSSPSGSGNYGNLIGYYGQSDSAKSNRIINSNSGASSVVSTSATVNLFEQNEDEEGVSSINGLSQDNVIDMILTKRKLDRAENQLVSVE